MYITYQIALFTKRHASHTKPPECVHRSNKSSWHPTYRAHPRRRRLTLNTAFDKYPDGGGGLGSRGMCVEEQSVLWCHFHWHSSRHARAKKLACPTDRTYILSSRIVFSGEMVSNTRRLQTHSRRHVYIHKFQPGFSLMERANNNCIGCPIATFDGNWLHK